MSSKPKSEPRLYLHHSGMEKGGMVAALGRRKKMGLLGGYAETPEEAAAIEARDRAYHEAHKNAQRIAELENALSGLVEAVKAGCAVSGAEAMGAAEIALASRK